MTEKSAKKCQIMKLKVTLFDLRKCYHVLSQLAYRTF